MVVYAIKLILTEEFFSPALIKLILTEEFLGVRSASNRSLVT